MKFKLAILDNTTHIVVNEEVYYALKPTPTIKGEYITLKEEQKPKVNKKNNKRRFPHK